MHSIETIDQTISEKDENPPSNNIYKKKNQKKRERKKKSEREKSPRKGQVPEVHSKKEKRTGHSG